MGSKTFTRFGICLGLDGVHLEECCTDCQPHSTLLAEAHNTCCSHVALRRSRATALQHGVPGKPFVLPSHRQAPCVWQDDFPLGENTGDVHTSSAGSDSKRAIAAASPSPGCFRWTAGPVRYVYATSSCWSPSSGVPATQRSRSGQDSLRPPTVCCCEGCLLCVYRATCDAGQISGAKSYRR